MEIKKGEIYKHYKGGKYKILISEAKDCDSLKNVVIYKNIETGIIYTRPVDEFLEVLDKKKYPNVEQQCRFEKVKPITKIKITYGFYTEGDYSLRNYENFACTGIDTEVNGEYYNYYGEKIFENEDKYKCKRDAKAFLSSMLCDGIHVVDAQYWILGQFFNKIDNLINFIQNNNENEYIETIGKNYDETFIKVEFLD